jgi:hypothetical protein
MAGQEARHVPTGIEVVVSSGQEDQLDCPGEAVVVLVIVAYDLEGARVGEDGSVVSFLLLGWGTGREDQEMESRRGG